MATAPRKLVEGTLLNTTAVILYVVPAGTVTKISKATVQNVTGAVATVTCYLVPSGGSPTTTNVLPLTRAVPTGAPLELYELYHNMSPGSTLQALSDTAAALSIQVSGIEIQ